MDIKKLLIDYPLVDEDLNPNPDGVEFSQELMDEMQKHEVSINVNSFDMVPTAVAFSLKSRINADFIVNLKKFPGSDFVYSFLKSSHIKEINYER